MSYSPPKVCRESFCSSATLILRTENRWKSNITKNQATELEKTKRKLSIEKNEKRFCTRPANGDGNDTTINRRDRTVDGRELVARRGRIKSDGDRNKEKIYYNGNRARSSAAVAHRPKTDGRDGGGGGVATAMPPIADTR